MRICLLVTFCMVLLVNITNGQVANIINEELPDQIGRGNHATIIKSISQLMAVSLRASEGQNVLAYKNVSDVQSYENAAWVAYNTTDWKYALDNENRTSWLISKPKVRFTVDLEATWVYLSAFIVGQDYAGGEHYVYSVLIETSDDKNNWTVRLGETSSNGQGGLNCFMIDSSPGDDRYVRITITSAANSTNPFKLYQLAGFTQRPEGITKPIFINWDQSVGLGTSNTNGYKLAVNGSIRSKEVKVEASPWPDYVFAKSYQLMSLEETKAYIALNQHLPGMPSAAEVEKDGIALGEMNAKLLEKIEELTLYIIRLNENNLELERRIKELENK